MSQLPYVDLCVKKLLVHSHESSLSCNRQMLCYPIVDLRPRPDVIHLIVGFVELGIPRWDCMPPYSMGDWHLGPW